MASETRTVEVNQQVFEWLCRGAALDGIDAARYLEILVMRDARYIRTREFLEAASPVRVGEDKKPVRADEHPKKTRLAA
jgi:hypothetical protein